MEENQIELRSDEVQEILGTPPSWIVRWGTILLFLGVSMMALVGWLIRYPDVIDAKIVLTTETPPVGVIARTEGPIAQFLVKDNDVVSVNQVIMILQSTANYEDVLKIDKLVTALQKAKIDSFQYVTPLKNIELGEIQSEYSLFVQNLEDLKFGKTEKNTSVKSSVSSVTTQISRVKESITFDIRSKERAEGQLVMAQNLFKKQQDLYAAEVLSRVELERERLKLSDIEKQVEAFDENIIRKKNEIISLQKNIGEMNFSEKSDASTSSVRLRESLNNLRSALEKWKQTYLLTAPIEGRVSLNNTFFSAKQFVKQGDLLLTIVPNSNDKIVGRVMLPVAGSGKVKENQRVLIRLDNYPYHEFGTLEGKVESKSLVPKDDLYAIRITMPDSLVTSYRKPIVFQQQLQGSAQIITENKRFLQRIWEQIFAKTSAYQ
jgi:multidrug efflux pump subunit AcrA (membrane-fusion protein)